MRLTTLNDLLHAGERIDGVWTLTPRHELRYRRRGPEAAVVLAGALVGTEPRGLTFHVTGESLSEELVGRTLTLRGRWQADARNRLTFLVERARGRSDRLTLRGGWALGPRQELRYQYQQDGPGARRDRVHTLTFAGAWALTAGRQLTYVMDAASDSTFRFRGAFQTPSVLAKTGELRYQLGVEAAGRRRVQTLTVFGVWRLSRTLGVTFEIPCADGRVGTLRFGASYRVGARGTVTAALTARDGRPLGLEVVFTREFWRGQGALFVRLRRAFAETGVEGGVRIRW